jgi:hypothetical protein
MKTIITKCEKCGCHVNGKHDADLFVLRSKVEYDYNLLLQLYNELKVSIEKSDRFVLSAGEISDVRAKRQKWKDKCRIFNKRWDLRQQLNALDNPGREGHGGWNP